MSSKQLARQELCGYMQEFFVDFEPVTQFHRDLMDIVYAATQMAVDGKLERVGDQVVLSVPTGEGNV